MHRSIITYRVLLHIGIPCRAVARSENPGVLVVMDGDNVSPLVEIGLTDLPKTGGAEAPQPPACDCIFLFLCSISNQFVTL